PRWTLRPRPRAPRALLPRRHGSILPDRGVAVHSPCGSARLNVLQTLRPGLFTTVQDAGRFGGSRWGVPVSGVADALSARIANARAGNDDRAAVLEVTLGTAEFSLLTAC